MLVTAANQWFQNNFTATDRFFTMMNTNIGNEGFNPYEHKKTLCDDSKAYVACTPVVNKYRLQDPFKKEGKALPEHLADIVDVDELVRYTSDNVVVISKRDGTAPEVNISPTSLRPAQLVDIEVSFRAHRGLNNRWFFDQHLHGISILNKDAVYVSLRFSLSTDCSHIQRQR